MNDAKLRLSAEEMRLVTDPAWILTKNSIISKVVGLFAALSGEWRSVWEAHAMSVALRDERPGAMAELPVTTPKLSKGENYKGLPYVMLDYPRVFGREDVFAIRTLFWWGHAFSVTLHLKGIYLDLFLPVIHSRRDELATAGFEWGISEDEWEHAHTADTYRPLVGEDPDATPLSPDRRFVKLSARCGLERWDEAPEWLTGRFDTLREVLSVRVDI